MKRIFAWLGMGALFVSAACFSNSKETVTVANDYRKPTPEELRKRLTPEQYRCTQEEGTERPFENPYWNKKDDGIYVDVVSGEPLFSSLDKYDSGTGWPSFSRPIGESHLSLKQDLKLGLPRTEVRSKLADSHLGHVFDDGPRPTGKRFCMNSAALRFVPLEDLAQQGYSEFLFTFAAKKGWELATLAGGCFWGMEELLRQQPGILATHVGYSGGAVPNARYEQVKTGETGHAESVQILFDPQVTSYEKILLFFFKMHDPTTENRQGNDVGTQYRSVIFYANASQKEVAQKVIQRVDTSGAWKKPVVTRLEPFQAFWLAEDYHQKYLVKHPHGYTCHFLRKVNF